LKLIYIGRVTVPDYHSYWIKMHGFKIQASAEIIQIFAKQPLVGMVKTRLIPMLGAVGATQFYHRLCWQQLQRLAYQHTIHLYVYSHHHGFFRQCQQVFACQIRQQQGLDLGMKMAMALQQGVRQAQRVVLIGTDCPHLDADYIQAAFQALRDGADVVLGPANDGGYVLIGVNQLVPPIFSGIPWSSERVLSQTIRRLRRLRLSYTLLPVLADMDTPMDLLTMTPSYMG